MQRSEGQHVSTKRGLSLEFMPADVADPIRAGIRARATADLCEALQVPAVLLDADGLVLHATSLAASALADIASVARGHLICAASAEIDRQMQVLRSSGLDRSAVDGSTTQISGGSGMVSLTMIRYGDSSAFQQVSLLLIVGEHSPLVVSALADGERILQS